MFWIIISIILSFHSPVLADDYKLTVEIQETRIDIRQDPTETSPYSVADRDVTIQVEASDLADRPWRLYILALEDLNGPVPITASEVSWQALTPPFIDGTLVKGVPQLLAQGRGDVNLIGRLLFRIRSANYEAGSYNLRMRFILSSP